MTARPTSRVAAISLLSCATLGLAACGSGQTDGTPARNGGGSVIRAEAACDVKGVKAPLRRTVILVDAKALHKSDNGLTFAERNTAFRDLILSIADPAAALPAGTSAAREQIVIAVVPADGSAARTAFVGCIPGMSPQELAAAQQRESGVSSMFSSGVARSLEEQATNFRTQLIGGMVAAASQGAAATGSQSGTVDAAPFLAGVRASKGLFDDDGRAQRIVLFSDLSGVDLPPGDPASIRKAGIEAGRKAGADLSQADIHVVLPSGKSIGGKDFFDAYWLAQGARLLSYAPDKLANVAAPPVRLWRFAGQAAYPSGPELVDIRIGEDGKGKLTASWLTLLGTPSFAVPMTGSIVCSGDECAIQSDKGGFAQAWSEAPGGEPEFRNDLPFGGMRNFALKIAGDRISGQASDEGVYIGADHSRQGIAITGKTR